MHCSAIRGWAANKHCRGFTGRPSHPMASPEAHQEDYAAAEPCRISLAAVAVVLAAFPGNPAQAVLASSSLLNLPFKTTARSLSTVPFSPGTSPKHAHAHLLGWAELGWQDLWPDWWTLGGGQVRAGEQASFNQGSAGFPQRSPCSLFAKARPHSSGTICPSRPWPSSPVGSRPSLSP